MSDLLDRVAVSLAKADKDAPSYDDLARAAIEGLRDALSERRGDPRNYGQGFHDPYGALIASLTDILR